MSDQLIMEFDIERKFDQYHKENPGIYIEFDKIAKRLIAMNFKHQSAKFIFEVMRWETAIKAKDDVFKVNNSYTALYARLFEAKNPNHKGFFRKRNSKFDEQ